MLGDPRVGKTSLIKSIVTGGVDLINTRESDQMFSLLNQRRDFEQELTKHRLQLDDNLSIPVSFVSAIEMGADLNLKKRSLEIVFLFFQGQKLLFLLRSSALSEQFNAIKAIRK